VAVETFPVLAGLFGGPGDALLGRGQVGQVLGDVERQRVQVESAGPERGPRGGAAAGSPRPARARRRRRGCARPPRRSAPRAGRRPAGPGAASGPAPPGAGGSEVWKAFHTSGNAHRASDNSRRRYRLAALTAEPRRTHRRRSANSAGLGRRSGVSSNTSPARASTSASMTSVLFLPLIAPRSREAWREPSSANWPPVPVAAIDMPNQ